jgi:hypothetical protein
MKKIWFFLVAVLALGMAFAQGLDSILTSEAMAYLASIAAIAAVGSGLVIRGVALALERSWLSWFKVGDRPIFLALLLGLVYVLAVFNPKVLANAAVLNFVPAWISMVIVLIWILFGSSGSVDLKAKTEGGGQ